MIIGCGVDIIQVERFSKWQKNDMMLKRFFHPNEVEYVLNSTVSSLESIAVRFAAKEAFGKALGTGIGCLTLKNICVVKDTLGRPCLEVYDDVAERLKQCGANRIHLSLSHEKDYAVAQVILEKV